MKSERKRYDTEGSQNKALAGGEPQPPFASAAALREIPLPEEEWTVEYFRPIIESFSSARDILRMAYFTTPRTAEVEDRLNLWRSIGFYARHVDEELLRVVSSCGMCPETFLENPNVSKEELLFLGSVMVAEMEEWAAKEGPAATYRPLAVRGLLFWAGAGLLGEGTDLSMRLLALRGKKNGNVESGLAAVLLKLPYLPAKDLAWIANLPQRKYAEEAAHHPNADIRVWSHFLVKGSESGLLFLSEVPKARKDIGVREHLRELARKRSPETLLLLSSDSVPGEFTSLLSDALSHGEKWAALMLNEAKGEQLAEIKRSTILTLLNSKTAELRLAAIRASREMGTGVMVSLEGEQEGAASVASGPRANLSSPSISSLPSLPSLPSLHSLPSVMRR